MTCYRLVPVSKAVVGIALAPPVARPAATFLLLAGLGLSLSGCATFSADAGLSVAQATASAELAKSITKVTTDAEAATVRSQVERLARSSLTPDSAVQIALLNNRGLQAAFNDLGKSEADFVRATLPPTPRFSYARLTGPGELDVTYQVVGSLFELATLPARQAIAEKRFRAAQYRAAEEVLRLAAEARRQYFRTVAANQTVGFLEQAIVSAASASEIAKQLGETGALNKLEQAREHAFYGELGAQLARARVQQRVEREALVRQLGFWGRNTDFRLPASLPPLPKKIQGSDDLEALALRKRVDIVVARADLLALAGEYNLGNATRFINAFDFGFTSNPETTTTAGTASDGTPTVVTDRVQRRGPSIDFDIPIYDFGESAVRGAREAYLAEANRLAERAVNARSEVREAYLRYRGNYDITRHYESTVLPINKTIQDEALLQYSGMLVDVTQLIIDARARIFSNIQAIEARRDFWIAATDLKAAIVGGGFGPGGDSVSGATTTAVEGPAAGGAAGG